MCTQYGAMKLKALRHKFDSTTTEFACWRLLSRRDGQFEKHHRQIRRIQTRLRPLCRAVRASLAGASAETALNEGRALELQILSIHRIWEFFRGKMAQREGRLARFLDAADEFAWACYQPARSRAFPDPTSAQAKEPPLVFFNGGLSPFAVPRDQRFRGEEIPNEPLAGDVLQDILERLPVPVVGIPWYQTSSHWDALVIGHEVGHLVAEDFQLREALETAVASLTSSRCFAGSRKASTRTWRSAAT